MQFKVNSNNQSRNPIFATNNIRECQQVEETWQRRVKYLRKHNQALVLLATSKTFQQSNLDTALREITQVTAQMLDLERVSIWLYNSDNTAIQCVEVYSQSTNHHSSGMVLKKKNYPTYFQALEKEHIIAAYNPFQDKRTQELSDSYLALFNIKSLLVVKIWLKDTLMGVVCYEQVKTERQWTSEEVNFAESIANFVTLAIEASQQNAAQEALQERERRFSSLFELSSIGIAFLNMNAQIVDTNPAFCRMLGYSKQEICGKNFTNYFIKNEGNLELEKKLVSETDSRETITIESREKLQEQTILTEHCLEMEQCFFHKDGQIVWTHINISLIKSKNDKPIFWLVITEDITERKSLEFKLSKSQREAEAASRAKDEFLATVSHELRTPLNTIMGLSQLLQEEKIGTLNDKQKEYISYIYTSGNDLLALINNMFDISHVETDTKDLLMLPLQVHQLCADVIATVRDSVLEKGLELTTEIDENVDTYIGDERRIKQMLLNLLSNAVKFTSTGKVSLEVKKVTKGILLRISDTGIGIHPDHLKLLFQPFQQLDSQLNRQYEGTGLGLALTRKFARLHGGDVSVESVLGQGSRFSIFLPDQASQRESGISKVEDIESETKRKALEKPLLLSSSITSTAKKILLVENEDHTANLLQNYLQVIGYQVEWIKDGKDFLTRVRSLQPNLIFVSMDLAASFGDKDLLDKLRAQPDLQNIPVIIMIQTNSLPQNKINLNKYSVTEFISKPFGIFQLESILVKYLT